MTGVQTCALPISVRRLADLPVVGGDRCSGDQHAALAGGFDMQSVMHEGCRVTGDAAKYVARVNVMYAF